MYDNVINYIWRKVNQPPIEAYARLTATTSPARASAAQTKCGHWYLHYLCVMFHTLAEKSQCTSLQAALRKRLQIGAGPGLEYEGIGQPTDPIGTG